MRAISGRNYQILQNYATLTLDCIIISRIIRKTNNKEKESVDIKRFTAQIKVKTCYSYRAWLKNVRHKTTEYKSTSKLHCWILA